METKLSIKIKEEIATTVEDYGYKSKQDFIEDALWHRILELRKHEFLTGVKKIREKMKKKGFNRKKYFKEF